MESNLSEAIVVREWSAEAFHRRVLELEAEGYSAQRDTYTINPEMNPDTGEVIHLHAIEMWKSNSTQH
jgi:hypothetical protein